ncbi:MAG TPA: hypothetical protein VF331_17320 [Polyangiales bacterium]
MAIRPLRAHARADARVHRGARPGLLGSAASGLAFVLVCGSLVGELASLAHLVLVHHSVCPEHGELVHSDEAESAARASSPAPGRSAALSAGHAPDAAHAHDHCALAMARKERALPPARLALVAWATPQPAACGDMRACAPTQRKSVFGYAPKASPPG